jgi:hypothetical protein
MARLPELGLTIHIDASALTLPRTRTRRAHCSPSNKSFATTTTSSRSKYSLPRRQSLSACRDLLPWPFLLLPGHPRMNGRFRRTAPARAYDVCRPLSRIFGTATAVQDGACQHRCEQPQQWSLVDRPDMRKVTNCIGPRKADRPGSKQSQLQVPIPSDQADVCQNHWTRFLL